MLELFVTLFSKSNCLNFPFIPFPVVTFLKLTFCPAKKSFRLQNYKYKLKSWRHTSRHSSFQIITGIGSSCSINIVSECLAINMRERRKTKTWIKNEIFHFRMGMQGIHYTALNLLVVNVIQPFVKEDKG